VRVEQMPLELFAVLGRSGQLGERAVDVIEFALTRRVRAQFGADEPVQFLVDQPERARMTCDVRRLVLL